MTISRVKIQKLETWRNLLSVSLENWEIHLYQLKELQLLQVFSNFSSIIDWHFTEYKILVLEVSASKVIWTDILLDPLVCRKNNDFKEKFYPLKYFYHKGLVFTFGINGSVLISPLSDLSTMTSVKLDYPYCDGAVFADQFFITTDDGGFFRYENDGFVKEKIELGQDSLLLALDDMVFSANQSGKSWLISLNAKVLAEFERNGPIIDAVSVPLKKYNDYESIMAASVQIAQSDIYQLSKSLSIFIVAKIKNIATFCNHASFIDNFLFLMPKLIAINTETYKVEKISELGLADEKTLGISKKQGKYVQITENKILSCEQEKFVFSNKALCCYILNNFCCVGLISQTVLFFDDYQLVFSIENIDFSTVFIADFVYIGLQQSVIKKLDFSGQEIELIETVGIPHSYL